MNEVLDRLLLRVGLILVAFSILFIGALIETRLEAIEKSLRIFNNMTATIEIAALRKGARP